MATDTFFPLSNFVPKSTSVSLQCRPEEVSLNVNNISFSLVTKNTHSVGSQAFANFSLLIYSYSKYLHLPLGHTSQSRIFLIPNACGDPWCIIAIG